VGLLDGGERHSEVDPWISAGAATLIATPPRSPSIAWRATLAATTWMKVVRGMGIAIGENGSSSPTFRNRAAASGDRCPTCRGSWILWA
jgi:hypothetical protein